MDLTKEDYKILIDALMCYQSHWKLTSAIDDRVNELIDVCNKNLQ